MPTPPAAPQVLKHLFKLTDVSDVDIIGRIFLQYSGTAPTTTTLTTYAGAIGTAWSAHMAGLFASGTSLTNVEVIDLTAGATAVGNATYSIAGSRSGSSMPAGVAALLNQTIARRYRGGKPRRYWPMGVQADIQTAQTWSASFQTQVNAAYAAFIAALIAAPPTGTTLTQEVNVSLYKGFVSSQNPITLRWRNLPTYRTGGVATVDPVLTTALNIKFGSQRRRNLHSS